MYPSSWWYQDGDNGVECDLICNGSLTVDSAVDALASVNLTASAGLTVSAISIQRGLVNINSVVTVNIVPIAYLRSGTSWNVVGTLENRPTVLRYRLETDSLARRRQRLLPTVQRIYIDNNKKKLLKWKKEDRGYISATTAKKLLK